MPHSAARNFSRGNALYSSLWRSAMRSLVLFLTFVSYFQEQWGLLCLPFRASPEGIVGSEVGSVGGLVRYIGSGIFTTILFLPSPVCPFFNLSSLCSFFFSVRCIIPLFHPPIGIYTRYFLTLGAIMDFSRVQREKSIIARLEI